MATSTTPVEGTRYGMLPPGQGYPEDFDLDNEIDTYRFHLMCKMKFNFSDLFQKKYDIYMKDLNERLLASSNSPKFVKKVVDKITFAAYYSIPDYFYEKGEKK